MSNDKIALVTGSSRGIGAESAVLFARRGYSVCINYRSDKKAAEDVKDRILSLGVECICIKADVSKAEEVSHLFSVIDESLGKITVLVNNVGILRTQSRLSDISANRFSEVLNTNVMSCFLCSQEAMKRMSTRKGGRGGSIVNVSSGAAKSGSPNEYIDYASSKGAIVTFTRGLACEVAEEGIRVNAVRPGLIHTDIHVSGGEPDRVDRLKERIPLQRGGTALEVAEAIYWLAEEKSSFVTGSFIDVTGGL